jgi:hypothetical protein
MAVTSALTTLLQRLHTDQALISHFESSPSGAVQDFDLTAHERDAVVTRDLDDFVNLGAVNAIEELPAVLRGAPSGHPGPRPSILDRLRRVLDRIRRRQPAPSQPRPIDPGTLPGPRPRPVPGPHGPDPPGPTPGPDPPGPNLPGPDI